MPKKNDQFSTCWVTNQMQRSIRCSEELKSSKSNKEDDRNRRSCLAFVGIDRKQELIFILIAVAALLLCEARDLSLL